MRSIMFAISMLLAAATLERAEAGIHPSAGFSVIPAPLVLCPAGDMPMEIAVRDHVNSPMSGYELDVWFGSCPAVQFAPLLGDEGYGLIQNGSAIERLQQPLDMLGRATVRIRGGGTCPAGMIYLSIAGRYFTTRPVASPDQDGNLGVGQNDLALAEAKLGTADPTADFNGDGTVTSADLDILRGHLGHHAPGMVTAISSRSWGAIKRLYQ